MEEVWFFFFLSHKAFLYLALVTLVLIGEENVFPFTVGRPSLELWCTVEFNVCMKQGSRTAVWFLCCTLLLIFLLLLWVRKNTGGSLSHCMCVAVFVNACTVASWLKPQVNAVSARSALLIGQKVEGQGLYCLFQSKKAPSIEHPVWIVHCITEEDVGDGL